MVSGYSTLILLAASLFSAARAFDMSASTNVVTYWGQNSGFDQQTLSAYCQDEAIDTFPLAFMDVFFSTGGLPSINLANACQGTVFPNSQLLDCSFLASDIKTCQGKGKIVTISLGGATGSGGLTDANAVGFADMLWNSFLGGNSSTRPFGNAVLDGIDLDIEGGGSGGYVTMINRLRTHFNGASKKFFITGAPQCPFPDANMGPILDNAHFDAVYVQYYNNYCGLTEFSNPNAWNFATWDNWAKTTSPNKNVKVYIGAPGSPTSAGSGYVDAATLASIAAATRAQYSSFGGIMLWDASTAQSNGRFDLAIKNALLNGKAPPPAPSSAPASSAPASSAPASSAPTSAPSAPTAPASPVSSPPAGPASGSACSASAWVNGTVYVGPNFSPGKGASQVTFKGRAYTARFWSNSDEPDTHSGPYESWIDGGSCAGKRADVRRSRAHHARHAARQSH